MGSYYHPGDGVPEGRMLSLDLIATDKLITLQWAILGNTLTHSLPALQLSFWCLPLASDWRRTWGYRLPRQPPAPQKKAEKRTEKVENGNRGAKEGISPPSKCQPGQKEIWPDLEWCELQVGLLAGQS